LPIKEASHRDSHGREMSSHDNWQNHWNKDPANRKKTTIQMKMSGQPPLDNSKEYDSVAYNPLKNKKSLLSLESKTQKAVIGSKMKEKKLK